MAIQYLIKTCGHAFWRRGSGITDTVRQADYSANEYCYKQELYLESKLSNVDFTITCLSVSVLDVLQ